MIATLRDYMKHYQSRLLRPFNSPVNHSGSIEHISQMPIDQPISDMVTDPVQDLAVAEQRFQNEQIASGFQVKQSGVIDSAADAANLAAFEENSKLPDLSEVPDPLANDSMQPGYPDMQQQAGDAPAPEPMPHPSLFGMGGL